MGDLGNWPFVKTVVRHNCDNSIAGFSPGHVDQDFKIINSELRFLFAKCLLKTPAQSPHLCKVDRNRSCAGGNLPQNCTVYGFEDARFVRYSIRMSVGANW